MDYTRLLKKKALFEENKKIMSEVTAKSYSQSFDIEYTHNSTAIEGNTLTLIETKVVLEDKLSIGGKYLREIYEVINHNNAFQYIKKCIANNIMLDEKIIKDVHQMLMENIMVGGIYRNVDVFISGAKHTPPTPNMMYEQVKSVYYELQSKKDINPIEIAAWTHAEFVKIHPFVDGNGRTSRLIMNYQLMSNGFLPISIVKESRLNYFNALECYAIEGNLQPFVDIIAELEENELDKFIALKM